jgi:hypothetical protein
MPCRNQTAKTATTANGLYSTIIDLVKSLDFIFGQEEMFRESDLFKVLQP